MPEGLINPDVRHQLDEAVVIKVLVIIGVVVRTELPVYCVFDLLVLHIIEI